MVGISKNQRWALIHLKPVRWTLMTTLALCLCGCTSLGDYIHNGFKVGPNYKTPPAPVAEKWIDADDVRVRSKDEDTIHWWKTFNDPVLDNLVETAYGQNLTLREAGFRVLKNRAMLTGAIGTVFPQTQNMNGDDTRTNLSREVANREGVPQAYYGQLNYGFNLAWELDFWGRFRRAIESSRAELNASVENYDDVLVTLIGDVASTYVQIRTLQQQIAYAEETLALQKASLTIATAKFKGGQVSQIDVNQGTSDVANTEALIEELRIPLRQAMNRLCVLMGTPPEELTQRLGQASIPVASPDVAVGIPANLLRRRPDVRRAERQAAAQCAQIGVAVSELYPHISIVGTFGWSAQQAKGIFAGDALRGTFGPTFTWNILQYGRLVSNVRAQDAEFQALVVNYQNTVLNAGKDVEDGLVTFLRAQKRRDKERIAVDAELAALKQAMDQYKGGLVDFNRVVVIQERLVERQQTLAAAEGQVGQGLIQVYRALGGGWQIRCNPAAGAAPAFMEAPTPVQAGFGAPAPGMVNDEPTTKARQENRAFKSTPER